MKSEVPKVDFIATNRNEKFFRRDPSYIYRCENVAMSLEQSGIATGLHHLNSYKVDSEVGAVVLHRPRWSLRLRLLVARLRRLQIPVLADVDDLIFDRNLAQHSPAFIGGKLSLRKVGRSFQANKRGLSLVDHIVVSTEALLEHARRKFPKVPSSLLHNSVHQSWKKPAIGCHVRSRSPKLITYCPGTASHDSDFKLVAPALSRFLSRNKNVRLCITGPLHHELASLGSQVEHHEKVPFSQYAQVVQRAWVNLAPLQSNPFNSCKSALKVLEAGFWSIPTICSPNRDASRFRSAGAIVASCEQEWVAALESLMNDTFYRVEVANLQARTLKLASVEAQKSGLLKAVDEVRLSYVSGHASC